jgi:hypothetical protein
MFNSQACSVSEPLHIQGGGAIYHGYHHSPARPRCCMTWGWERGQRLFRESSPSLHNRRQETEYQTSWKESSILGTELEKVAF